MTLKKKQKFREIIYYRILIHLNFRKFKTSTLWNCGKYGIVHIFWHRTTWSCEWFDDIEAFSKNEIEIIEITDRLLNKNVKTKIR